MKKRGYSITLIHVSAPDDVRWQSIQERDQTFIQTTEQDTCEKGLLLPQRINDTFLKYADRIEFHYRGGVKEDAQLGAIWTRNTDGAPILGSLKVVDRERYTHRDSKIGFARRRLCLIFFVLTSVRAFGTVPRSGQKI